MRTGRRPIAASMPADAAVRSTAAGDSLLGPFHLYVLLSRLVGVVELS